MAKVSAPSTFADWLRTQLDERGLGVRTLARKIDPQNPEAPRRAIYHYLRGSTPTEAYLTAIAEAFGVSRDEIPIEEVPSSRDPFRADGVRGAVDDRGGAAAGDGAAVTGDGA